MSDDAAQTLEPTVEPAVSDHEAALLEAAALAHAAGAPRPVEEEARESVPPSELP